MNLLKSLFALCHKHNSILSRVFTCETLYELREQSADACRKAETN